MLPTGSVIFVRHMLLSVAISGAVTLSLAPGCDRTPAGPAVAPVDAALPAIEVNTAPVRRGAVTQSISAPGSLVARRESQIGTEVAGRVVQVFVSEGDRVEAGAPLFQIDPVPYEMALRQAEAGLEVARAQRLQSEADLARAQTLRRQAVMAQQEYDRLVTGVAVARAQERQTAEALALARFNLDRTLVRAPYPASVAKRLVDEGTTALVQPQTIVLVLQETGELEAEAAIPESQLSVVQVGDQARLLIEGVADPIAATVSAVNDTIDPATRTYLVKMRVPNPDRRLKAGVFAHVEILPQAKRDVLVVPPDAIRTEEGRTRLLVVRDGRAQAVPVEVGLVSSDAAEIVHGLTEGEAVVVGEAARTVAPGMPVRVIPAAGPPA